MTVTVTRYPSTFWDEVNSARLRARQPWTVEQREAFRQDALKTRFDLQEEARRALFNLALPHIDALHFIHPDPLTNRQIARTLRRVRLGGWKQTLVRATIRDLDLSNDQHWHWLCVYGHWEAGEVQSADPDVPIRLPEGIPLGDPTAEERREFHPETTLWDIEDAAMHELELGMGGMATMMLHEELTTGPSLTIGDHDVPGLTERNAVRTRIANYLTTYRAYRRAEDWPEDPWDPNHWGHDTRIKTLTITNATTNQAIALTPEFDPEVMEYTTPDEIGAVRYAATFFDPLMTAGKNLAPAPTESVLYLWVNANDGVTRRKYTITKVGGD